MKLKRVNYSTYRIENVYKSKVAEEIFTWIDENDDVCWVTSSAGNVQTVSIMSFEKLNEFRDMLAMQKLKDEITLEEYYRD